MEIAKMTSKGQLTVPKAVREKLNLEPGSKVVFLQRGDELVIRNAETMTSVNKQAEEGQPVLYKVSQDALPAFRRLQEAFAELADEEGIRTDEELVEWMKSGAGDDKG